MSSVIALELATSRAVIAGVGAGEAGDIRSERVPCSDHGCAEATDGAGVWGSAARGSSQPANPDERTLKMRRSPENMVNKWKQTAINVLYGSVILVEEYDYPIAASYIYPLPQRQQAQIPIAAPPGPGASTVPGVERVEFATSQPNEVDVNEILFGPTRQEF